MPAIVGARRKKRDWLTAALLAASWLLTAAAGIAALQWLKEARDAKRLVRSKLTAPTGLLSLM